MIPLKPLQANVWSVVDRPQSFGTGAHHRAQMGNLTASDFRRRGFWCKASEPIVAVLSKAVSSQKRCSSGQRTYLLSVNF